MRKKKKATSLLTPEERAGQLARHRLLEQRIRMAEDELTAAGSPIVTLDRGERLAYAISRAEAELTAKPTLDRE